MILNDLIHSYDVLQSRGIISFGWNKSGSVHFGIDINEKGELLQVIPFTENKKPKEMMVPSTVKKETGTANFKKFIYGNAKYFLGYTVDSKGNGTRKITKRIDSFSTTRDYHIQLLNDVHSVAAHAIIKYFEYYSQHHDELLEMINPVEHKEYDNAYFILCFNGIPVQSIPEITKAWTIEFPKLLADENKIEGISLLSGKRGPIARTHNSVSVPGGTNPTLISFNKESFESYGLTQSYNAAITAQEAYKYSAALNYLIKNDDYSCSLGAMTIIMWSENMQSDYSNTALDWFFGRDSEKSGLTQDNLQRIVKQITQGKCVDLGGIELDPGEKFYIAGLRANVGRVQLEFYLEKTFGDFIKNIYAHYGRMQLNDGFSKNLNPYQIICQTIRSKDDFDKANQGMKEKLLISILNNSTYPSAIYSGVINRIRKESKKVTSNKAQIIKMYLIKNFHMEEVTKLELNKESKSIPYRLGRLFAVLERIQSKASDGRVENLAEKHFNTAMTTPAIAFPKLFQTNQYYMRKFEDRDKIYFDRLIQEVASELNVFPRHLTQVEQGEFCLGYYHQKQEFFTKRSNSDQKGE